MSECWTRPSGSSTRWRPVPRSLTELARATGLPRATAHRLASALERHLLVGRDDAGPLRARAGPGAPGRPGRRQHPPVAGRRGRPGSGRAPRPDRRERPAVCPLRRHPGVPGLAGVAAQPAHHRGGRRGPADGPGFGGQGAGRRAPAPRHRAGRRAWRSASGAWRRSAPRWSSTVRGGGGVGVRARSSGPPVSPAGATPPRSSAAARAAGRRA